MRRKVALCMATAITVCGFIPSSLPLENGQGKGKCKVKRMEVVDVTVGAALGHTVYTVTIRCGKKVIVKELVQRAEVDES